MNALVEDQLYRLQALDSDEVRKLMQEEGERVHLMGIDFSRKYTGDTPSSGYFDNKRESKDLALCIQIRNLKPTSFSSSE